MSRLFGMKNEYNCEFGKNIFIKKGLLRKKECDVVIWTKGGEE